MAHSDLMHRGRRPLYRAHPTLAMRLHAARVGAYSTQPQAPLSLGSSGRHGASPMQEKHVLKYAIIFALISVVAGALGFTGLAAGAAGIAKVLFVVFLVLTVVFVVLAIKAASAVGKAIK
jgi:uncharacterized membrane protein YtjA (UPF0391 family)